MDKVERARELLAAEYERAHEPGAAKVVREQNINMLEWDDAAALRAIEAALEPLAERRREADDLDDLQQDICQAIQDHADPRDATDAIMTVLRHFELQRTLREPSNVWEKA